MNDATNNTNNNSEANKDIVCIYHGNCADGFGAAWVVRRALGNIEFVAGVYQNPPPDVTGKFVIFVDFSYKRAVIEEMRKKAKGILILDHHKTAIEDLSPICVPASGSLEWMLSWVHSATFTPCPVFSYFNVERSGVGLAWTFFFTGYVAPMLLRYIQDRDLWKFELPDSRNVNAALFSYPYNFDVWDSLMDDDFIPQLITEGRAIERKHFKDLEELLKVGRGRTKILGYDVPIVNLPYTFASDAGHIMAENEPFAATFSYAPDGIRFSLRSREQGGVDVSQIAKAFGGGGHKHAAGFTVPLSSPFPAPISKEEEAR